MRLLPPQYEIVTATCDPAAGEIGTIYQACGFHYVALDTHARYHVAGTSSRTLRSAGLYNKADFLRRGLVPQVEHQKARYFAFRGSRATQRRHLAALAGKLRPYPRRVPH